MINLGNFGNTNVRRPDATAPVQQPSRGAVMVNIGQMVGNLAQQMGAEKAELNKARGGALLAEAKVQAHQLQAGLVERVNRGEIKPEDMVSVYQTEYAGLQERLLDGQDDSLKQLVSGPMGDMFKVSEIGVFDMGQAKIRDGFEAEMISARGSFERLALTDPAGAIDQLNQVYDSIGPKAGWDSARISAAKQKDAQSFYTNNRLNWAGQEESISQLKAEEAKLSDDNYLPQLGDNRVRYRDYVQTRIRELKSQKEARTRDWEVSTVNQMRLFGDLYENGAKIPPGIQDEVTKFEQSIKGTKYAPLFAAMKRENAETREMAMSPLSQQARMIEKTSQAVMDAQDPETAQRLKAKNERMTANFARNIKSIQADPYGYAKNVHGIETAPLDFSRDMSGQLQERDRVRMQVQARTGVNPGMFIDAEAQQIVQLMDSLPAAQQEGMFRVLAGSDQDTQRVTLAQLGKVDPLKMYAGAHTLARHTANVNGVGGRSVGAMLLEGQKLVAGKQIQMEPKTESTIRAEVAKYAGAALSHDPEAFAAVAPMVTSFLAFQQKDRGNLTMKPSQEEIKQAVDIVTGGIVKFNDSTTILPYGMKPGEFKEKAPAAVTGALSSLGYSQTQRNRMIDTVQLRPSNKPDEYYLFNGRDPIMGRDGQPARVRIR